MAAKTDPDRDGSSMPSAPLGASQQLAGERELWERFAKDRDPAIREELVRRYLPFAKNLALRYRGASESFDDLLQVASLGLVNAIDRFDPDRGAPFTPFASPPILGELKRHFRDRVWTVRVPRGLHDRMAEVDKTVTELTKKLQRSPSVGEIAERLGLEQTDVLEVMEANHNRRPLSLDRPAGAEDSDEAPPSEWVGEEDERFELVEGRIALDAALPYLEVRSGHWLLDRSSRPHRSPRLLDGATQERICEWRRRTGWGPRLVAGSGPALGISCTWTPRVMRALSAPGTRSPEIARNARAGGWTRPPASALTSATRSSMTVRAWPTSSCIPTSGPPPSPPSSSELWSSSARTGLSPSA